MSYTVLSEYIEAFCSDRKDSVFLHYYSFDAENNICKRAFTRGEFFTLALQAAQVLKEHGCTAGKYFINCFGENKYQDLAFRLGAIMVGAVPVTINWQADNLERVIYKIELTDASLILTDQSFSSGMLEDIRHAKPRLPLFAVEDLENQRELPQAQINPAADDNAARIVIFTSGTTGQPKGVQLPYRAYSTNRRTFEKLLAVADDDDFAVFMTNPLHHTNSTAISDWCLRRPGSVLHLLQRYSTSYWKILAAVAANDYDKLIAPCVSRHFDFLDNLVNENKLPLELDELKHAMKKTEFLIGSAPVGPGTVKRLLQYASRIPTVRFGSTETCLQVLGIPAEMDDDSRLKALQKGWEHVYEDEKKVGYYIGRATRPYTEVRVVESVLRDDKNYLKDCAVGQPGYLITKGENLMSRYIKNPQATKAVFHGEWYSGLMDICFALKGEDGELDYYWQSRDSFMLICGGSNYAYDQINAELSKFIKARYGLDESSFEAAVVGLKVNSEHEDDCCLIIELKDKAAFAKKDEINSTFIAECKSAVSKGAKVDHLRFDKIAKNFKGAFLVKENQQPFIEMLGLQEK